MIDNFILDRLKVLVQTIKRSSEIANGEITGKSIYIAPQYSFNEVIKNNEKIIAELQDIILYEVSGETQPIGEHNGFNDDFQRIAYSNFGYDDTPHGINGTLTANIKQVATELLQARNCMNRVHSAMYEIMGFQGGLATAGKQQPQIFVDGMNKAFNLFEATRKALTEAVSILCNIVDFTPAEQPVTAIGGG